MFQKILYPTDFSDVSIKALDYIKQLRESGAEAVVVLHVVDQRIIQSIDQYAAGSSVKFKGELIDDAEKELRGIEEILKQSGFNVDGRLVIGNPVREILRVENEEDVSVLVIGSHGKSNMEEIFLGSVSEKVARKCKKPVLIIKR